MDIQTPKRPSRKARDRQQARRRKVENAPVARPPRAPRTGTLQGRLQALWQEGLWYARQYRLGRALLGLVGVGLLVYVIATAFSGRIYPNVSVAGVDIGRLRPNEATERLQSAWQNEMRVRVVADGELIETLSPSELGLQFDAIATVERARDLSFRVGLVNTPVTPIVTLPDSGYLAVQDYLLNMTERINQAPYNAGFAWENDTLVPVMGRVGRLLDIAPTLASLRDNPAQVLERREFVVQVSPVQPEVRDSSAYLDAVQAYASRPFTFVGYDPYTDTRVNWSTDRDTFTSWLEVDANGLTLREDVFAPFIDAQTRSLNTDEVEERYLNVEETLAEMRETIANQQSELMLRVRYRAADYVVVAGDTASRIARKTGIPFYLIEQYNPGRDLNILSIGDTLQLPTRDLTMPHEPVAHKRIVVDLRKQELWAFENGELVFNWQISSGQSSAPTSPGIYQVLSHSEVAYGSSFTLCGTNGCGQWEMYWFMGMYEVVPGLMNGFHGAVLLPNGGYLNGGATGFPSTFGCVMSPDELARQLYEWAELGTVVEIISDEFSPLSSLAASTLDA